MTQYHVDSAEVAQAASRAAASGATIRSEVQSMISHLQSLESSWQGGAAVAFGGLLAQWRAAQAQLEQALEGISGALARAATEYATAEESAARLFAR